ncbi:putative component of type IV pili like system [Halanaeroarchaeum sp. HSR-CO]|uniref:hypothetical protein n=1 Tax=Halanaeroarchaeum sp. HSR-CO TaxID=2866382 RepID=UPI00217E1861|nr:hypothetical protein [Halanaeroarchaeum sp. HSR-CO]UWG46508.1 putative component of type IV pili like system [Halanaeroarchaeum sp. HSR-CO]
MKRTLTVLLAVAMLVAAAAPAVAMTAPTAADATGDTLADTTTVPDESAENATGDTPPGAMLAGSIGVHESEMKGAIEQRAFGHQIAAAASNESKAQVLKQTQDRTGERLTDLEERKTRLEQARENGTIAESQYRAQVSVVAAESARIQAMANTTERTAQGIPNETLRANGVNVTALHQMRDRAHDMTGPEVAEIARQIAGDDVGAPMGPPEHVPGPQSGPQAGMGNSTGPTDDRPGTAGNGMMNGSRGDAPTNGGSANGPMTDETADEPTNETTTTEAT